MTADRDDDIRAPHLRRDDFLGAFAVVERDAAILMVQNRRVIGGRETETWDLPGGQVEPGESLEEALGRELREEVGLRLDGPPEFLFFLEGERVAGGARCYVWRSFFFGVRRWSGEPIAQAEVLAARWVPRAELDGVLGAPYHDSFATWLRRGGRRFWTAWAD